MSEGLDVYAEAMHLAWLEVMAEQGYHSSESCPTRPSTGIFAWTNCQWCRPGIVPWSDLPEEVKEVNRRGVRRLFEKLGFNPENPPEEGAAGKAREAAVNGIAYHDANDTRSCDCRYLYAALVKIRRALGGE